MCSRGQAINDSKLDYTSTIEDCIWKHEQKMSLKDIWKVRTVLNDMKSKEDAIEPYSCFSLSKSTIGSVFNTAMTYLVVIINFM